MIHFFREAEKKTLTLMIEKIDAPQHLSYFFRNGRTDFQPVERCTLQDLKGLSRNPLKDPLVPSRLLGPFWDPLDSFETLWTLLGPFGPFTNLKALWTLQTIFRKNLESNKAIVFFPLFGVIN